MVWGYLWTPAKPRAPGESSPPPEEPPFAQTPTSSRSGFNYLMVLALGGSPPFGGGERGLSGGIIDARLTPDPGGAPRSGIGPNEGPGPPDILVGPIST